MVPFVAKEGNIAPVINQLIIFNIGFVGCEDFDDEFVDIQHRICLKNNGIERTK